MPAEDRSGEGSGRARPSEAGQRLSVRTRALLIGGLIVSVGLVASAFLAGQWRSNVRDADRKSFESTATYLSSTLASKLDSNLNLTRSMRAVAAMEPNAGDTRFLSWYQQLRRGVSSSSGAVAELIQPVPASRLPAFRRQAETDPAFRALLKGTFQIVPPGRRPVYCLTRAIVGASTSSSLYPPLLDYCAAALPGIGRSPFASLIGTATDTGSSIVTPIPGFSLVAIGAAVYRPGARLATVAERRAARTGVIGTSFDSAALIGPLLAGQRSLAVTLYHRNTAGPLQLIGRAGAKSAGGSSAYAQFRELSDGWVVAVRGKSWVGPPRPLRVSSCSASARWSRASCFCSTSSSRARADARGAWSEKTGELEYRALHDPLTELPNRSLVFDRAEQLLARARRLDLLVTALFVDIDDFKQINDRFGRRVGDEVLHQVGARLGTVLRDSDTVGHLGGDEFVLLVDSAGLDAAPELVAERILDVLRQPIELPAPAQSPISLTASIGHRDRAVGLGRGSDARCQPRARQGQGRRARTDTRCSSRRCRPQRRIACTWR